jgi:transcriptional regulator with XRE-family HTH domain
MELRERLKRIRTALGESQEQFAKRFGVDGSKYNRWETGDRHPSRAVRFLMERVMQELQQEAMK